MMNPLVPGSSSSWQPPLSSPREPLPQPEKPKHTTLPLPLHGSSVETAKPLSHSGKAFTHLLGDKELSPAMKDILRRAEDLALQFDLFSQEEDGKEVSSKMVSRINILLQQFRNLQSEHVESISELHVDVQTKIGSELTKLTDRVAFIARDLEALQHVITVQNTVDQWCDAAVLFLKYEGSTTMHSIATYSALLEDLGRLLFLHNEIRSSISQIHNDDLRLAMISGLEESISRIAETLRPYQALCQRLASHGDRRALESLGPLLRKGELAVTALREHLVRYYTATVEQSQSLPHRFFASIFHAFRNPRSAILSGLDYLEEKAPLPAMSPRVLARQKEGQIEHGLRSIVGSLSDLQQLEVEVERRLEQLPVVEETVADRYADWLGGFADTCHQFAQLQVRLESYLRPEAEELASVAGFIEGVRQQQKALLQMGSSLRAGGFTAELWEALQDEVDDVSDQAVNLYDLLLFRHQINQFDDQADHYMENLEDQRVTLATGGTDFSVTHDCELLEQIEVLAMLYCRSERENLPPEYRQEMHSRLAHEVGALSFGRGEYSDDYRDALDAEVAKANLTMNSHRSIDSKESLRQCAQGVVYADHLLHQMGEAKRRLEQRERQLHTLIHPLISEKSAFNDGRSSLAKEFKKVYEQLQDDLSFITDQMEAIQSHTIYRTNHDAVTGYISTLSAEEATALGLEPLPESGSNWVIRLREANIERAVKRLEEPEDKPESWGMKVLRCTLWSLYFSEKIRDTAQFVSHAHQYWSTGENPLRPYADLLSHAAFARQAAIMSPADQAKAGLEMNMVEGILKGFIPYTPELAEEHPTIVRYLREKLNISPPTSTPALAAGSSQTLAHGGPDARSLSSDELNKHMTHFLGQRVQEHYSATGQQIGLESPSRVELQTPSPFLEWLMDSGDTAIEVREPPPLNPLQIIGADLSAAVRYQQQGHLEGDNPHLEQVQKTARDVFGTPLPSEWIEGWLFKQEWSEDRLSSFSSWLEQSLMTQASYHMTQQQKPSVSEPGTMVMPSPMLSDITTTGPNLEPLREVVALSLGALMQSSQEHSRGSLSLPELADLVQKVGDQCFAIADLEKWMFEAMEPLRQATMGDKAQLLEGGTKHAHLVLMDRAYSAVPIPGAYIPREGLVKGPDVQSLLQARAPELSQYRKQLDELYSQHAGGATFLDQKEVQDILAKINISITKTFEHEDAVALVNSYPELRALIEQIKGIKGHLIARSTAPDEDTKEVTNAGGNESVPYVLPEAKEVAKALGVVVGSYFSPTSLRIRLNAGQQPFKSLPSFPVIVMEHVGEPIGGATNPTDIPVGVVDFTNRQDYTGGDFRLYTASATYGQGSAIVKKTTGVNVDRGLVWISRAHPDRLNIVYTNVEKPARLGPVEENAEGSVVFGLLANPSELQRTPALTSEMIHRFVHSAAYDEAYFDDVSTDRESAIIGSKKARLQARAYDKEEMAEGDITATYLDLQKIASEGATPIRETLQGDLIVDVKAAFLSITGREQVLVARTLDEAEKKFVKGVHELVIVQEDEPDNTHAYVNFKQMKIPCLVFKDKKPVDDILSKIDASHPLAVCAQTATLHLWDRSKGEVQSFVSIGYAVHPAKITFSIPTAIDGPSTKPSRDISADAKSLLLSVRAAGTREEALEKLQQLQEHPWLNDVLDRGKHAEQQLASETTLPKEIRDRYETIVAFCEKLQWFMEEFEAALKDPNANRLEQLLNHKVIEALLIGRADKGATIGQFSVVDILAIDKDIDQLIAYQNRLTHTPHMLDLALVSSKAITSEAGTQWTEFLIGLESLIEEGSISKDKVVEFKAMLTILQRSNALIPWLTFSFSQTIQKGDSQQDHNVLLDRLIETLPTSDGPFVDLQLKTQDALRELRNQIDRFADPKSFPEAWDTLQYYASKAMQENLTAQMSSSSPVARMIAINTMKLLVDTFDDALKTFTAPNSWDEASKIPVFKEMLYPLLSLLEIWLLGPVRRDSIAMVADKKDLNSIEGYLGQLRNRLNGMPSTGKDQLLPGKDFTVIAAVIGIGDYTWNNKPSTLVDAFTTIHQSLLVAISSLNNDLFSAEFIQESALPEAFQGAMTAITSRKVQISPFPTDPSRTALEVDEESVSAKFNVPLRQHSAVLTLTHHKLSGELDLQVQFSGTVEFNRWENMVILVDALSKAGILPITNSISEEAQSVTFSWQLSDEAQLQYAITQFWRLASTTMGMWAIEYSFKSLQEEVSSEQLSAYADQMFLSTLQGRNPYLSQLLLTRLKQADQAVAIAKIGIIDQDAAVRFHAVQLCDHAFYGRSESNIGQLVAGTAEVLSVAMKDSAPQVRKVANNSIDPLLKRMGTGRVSEGEMTLAKVLMADSQSSIGEVAARYCEQLANREFNAESVLPDGQDVQEVLDQILLGAVHKDSRIRNLSLKMIASLISDEKYFAAGSSVVERLLQKDTSQLNLEQLFRDPSVLIAFIMQGESPNPAIHSLLTKEIDTVLETAKDRLIHIQTSSTIHMPDAVMEFKLLRSLVDRGYGYDLASNALTFAQSYSQPKLIEQALHLATAMGHKGQNDADFLSWAQEWVKLNPSHCDEGVYLALVTACVAHDKIEPAVELIFKWTETSSDQKMPPALAEVLIQDRKLREAVGEVALKVIMPRWHLPGTQPTEREIEAAEMLFDFYEQNE